MKGSKVELAPDRAQRFGIGGNEPLAYAKTWELTCK
jgi:hypothetical protein